MNREEQARWDRSCEALAERVPKGEDLAAIFRASFAGPQPLAAHYSMYTETRWGSWRSRPVNDRGGGLSPGAVGLTPRRLLLCSADPEPDRGLTLSSIAYGQIQALFVEDRSMSTLYGFVKLVVGSNTYNISVSEPGQAWDLHDRIWELMSEARRF